MATFQIDANGGSYEIDAPDEHAAFSAFNSLGGGGSGTGSPTPPEDDGSGSAAVGHGILNGVPVVGPAIVGSLSRAAAGIRSWQNGTSYDDELKNVQDFNSGLIANHPTANKAGEIGGGIAATLPMIAAAPAAFGAAPAMTFGSRVAAGLGSGLVLGGADAGVRSEAPTVLGRAVDVGMGAALGGAVGSAGPIVGAAASQAVPAIVNFARPALPNMGRAASRDLTAAYEAAGPTQVADTLARLGPEASLVDAGQPFLGRAQGIAAQPGAPGERIVSGLGARNEGTTGRLAGDVNEAFGPAPVPSEIEGQFAARRAATGPMYERSLAGAAPIDTTDAITVLSRELQTAEGPERRALLQARDMLLPQRGQDGARIIQEDARNLHNVKGALDDVIEYGDRSIGVQPGTLNRTDGALARVRGALNGALEAQAPRYAEANLGSSAAHRASEALRSGAQALNRDIHPVDFAAGFEAAPIEQQAAARLGQRGHLDQVLGNNANDLVALRREVMADGDWNRSKLATLFGPDEADRVFNAVDRETAFRDAYNRVVNGSNTAKIQEGVKATGVRDARPGSGDTGIAIAGAAGGPMAAVGAASMKAGRYGWNVLGRAADRARNTDIADAVLRTGPERDALVTALANRLASRSTPVTVTPKANLFAQALLAGSERRGNDAGRAKAQQLGRMLLEMK